MTFGIEWLADMARLICEAFPGTSIQQVAWDIPLPTFSYMVAMGLKAAGVKNVARHANADLVGRRTDQLIQEWAAHNV